MPLEFVHDADYLSGNVQEQFKAFLSRHCADAVTSVLLEMDVSKHFSVDVYAQDLIVHNAVLANLLIHRPERTLQMFDDALCDFETDILERLEADGDPFYYQMTLKPFVHARVHGLPGCAELCKPTISCIRTEDVGHLLTLTGTVTRAAAVRMLHAERKVACLKCGAQFKVKADLEQRNLMRLPEECGTEQGTRVCAGTKFADVEGTEVCRDYQELRVQEQVGKLGIGSIPRSITVVLHDDLVDAAKPGDDILVTGVMVRRWKPVRVDARVDVDLVLRANHLTVCNQLIGAGLVTKDARQLFDAYWRAHDADGAQAGYARFAGRDALLRGVCPELNGLFILKLALMLTLLGGVTRTDGSGQRVRGETHLLLIGDPGTGKSQALKFAAALSPRSVMTTGIGSTSAGLTVTASKDPAGGEWALDAGALVLADGGVCCIDEFETMREADRTTIHEAMEQQTLSVAKAGLVCKLRTRTTIIAATNPKRASPDQPFSLEANCDIATPLLSRFDVVLMLRDEYDAAWDAQVADFILGRDSRAEQAAAAAEGAGGGAGARRSQHGGAEPCWDEKTLRTYIECARREFAPTMSRAAERILTEYFERQRQEAMRNAARTTIRLLESLIRLSQAHARLMWRGTVLVADAVYAIVLIEAGSARVDGPLTFTVCRTEVPVASGAEAHGVVQRVCDWLGLSTDDDEPADDAADDAADDGGGGDQRARDGGGEAELTQNDALSPLAGHGAHSSAWPDASAEPERAPHALGEYSQECGARARHKRPRAAAAQPFGAANWSVDDSGHEAVGLGAGNPAHIAGFLPAAHGGSGRLPPLAPGGAASQAGLDDDDDDPFVASGMY